MPSPTKIIQMFKNVMEVQESVLVCEYMHHILWAQASGSPCEKEIFVLATNVFRKSDHSLLTTPNVPKTAPRRPTATAGHIPVDNAMALLLSKGVKDGSALPEGSKALPWPPPVRLAPFGLIKKYKRGDKNEWNVTHTPIGRESSANWQVEEVHSHLPAIGSQKGVEQLLGTKTSSRRETRVEGSRLTAETSILTSDYLLGGIRVFRTNIHLRASVLR